MKAALIYWPKGGSVEKATERIYNRFHLTFGLPMDRFELGDVTPEKLAGYDLFFVGGSTVGADSWQDAYAGEKWGPFNTNVKENYPDLFKGKKVALYGLGDQILYPEDFVNDMALLKKRFEELGAVIIGSYFDSNYEFSDSAAFDGESFVGLALDEVNQDDLSETRVENWLAAIKKSI